MYVHTYVCVCVCVCMHVCMYVCVCMHACVYVCMLFYGFQNKEVTDDNEDMITIEELKLLKLLYLRLYLSNHLGSSQATK